MYMNVFLGILRGPCSIRSDGIIFKLLLIAYVYPSRIEFSMVSDDGLFVICIRFEYIAPES